MATTTPNFGWPVPTSTDLVKDGATAIEGLGDAIDASLLDLKGGTSGQVLKKNSNTDMDFIWSADSAGMTNPMTTTGDTIYSSSGSTPARLGIGSTGQVLTVAGGVPSWATPAGGGGKVLQIVTGTYSTATTIASTTFTDSGLSLSITPTSSASKILLMITQPLFFSRSTGQAAAAVRIMRGATAVFTSDQEAYYVYDDTSVSAQLGILASFHYVDSPATTSSTTYKTQWRVPTTANSAQVIPQFAGQVSSITLMEIEA